MSLQSKWVLITGASAGIGAACSYAFAREGANLILWARRLENLEPLAAELRETYATHVHFASVDVRNIQGIQDALQNLPSEARQIDVLVNNAGLVIGLNKAHETPPEDVDTMIDTNVKGVLNTLREIVPGMVKRNAGQVINISSISGLQSYPGGSVYCGSKHAVHAITNSLRMDLVDTPIRVATVSPGLVDTEFSLVRFKGDAEKAMQVYKGLEPLIGNDIAEAVVFIATRPPHIQVADMIIFPTAQAAATLVHRHTVEG